MNHNKMKYFYTIFVSLIILVSCQKEDYFYQDTSLAVDANMWDSLQHNAELAYYTDLIKKYKLDSIFEKQNYTLFIPSQDALENVDTSLLSIEQILSHHIIPTLINVSAVEFYTKVQTQLGKFALVEYNISEGHYSFDGVSIEQSGELYKDGLYYILEDIALPPPNLYEFLAKNAKVYKDYIHYRDSFYFDKEASTPIGYDENNMTVYDSVFEVANLFNEEIFPVDEEDRDRSATFTIFTDEQYNSAIELMKQDLGIDQVPQKWIDEKFMPTILNNSVFDKSLQYVDFSSRMININSDSVNVDVENINEDSRFICSNGVVYTFNDFVIHDSLYKKFEPIRAMDMVNVLVEGKKWLWADDVKVEGLIGTGIEPEIQSSKYSSYGSMLTLNLGDDFHEDNNLRITYTIKSVFGADHFRLLWAGTNIYCGEWKIYVNDEPIQMRNRAGKDAEVFNSFEFGEKIKSVTGQGVYSGSGNVYNQVDFNIESINEYSDVEVTFEYIGPSLDNNGNVINNAGIVLDFLQLEIY